MDYHGITMVGPFLIEEVESLPETDTKKRMVYYEESIYFNDGSGWINMLNADTLDGYDAAHFAVAGHTHPYSPDTHDHDNTYLNEASNLGDLTNVAAARNNLGLGSAATHDDEDYADASHTHNYLSISNNLSDVNNVSNARSNLGLRNNATVEYFILEAGETPNNSDGRPNGSICYVKNE